MADPKLERLRALLREEAEKKNGTKSSSGGGDNASYPFWNIPENTAATVRFVPDADENNPWFWVERQTIKLTFDGIVGGEYPTSDQVTVTVPCVDMFHDTCPIITHTRPWWKDVNGKPNPMKETARKYYKKRSFITAGFVVSSPFEETTVPENPIRRFMLGSSLLQKIKAGLADPDMENLPTDYLGGCDFRIRKTRKQDFNNYDTSEWARRSRALTESEQLAIEQFKLYDLKTFLGPRPDADGIAVIKAMFHASLNGEPFDHESFGSYYRPYGGGNRSSGGDDVVDLIDAVEKQLPTQPATVAAEAKAEAPATDKSGDPQDLLVKLRARTANRS
jgi:hypothetical protein